MCSIRLHFCQGDSFHWKEWSKKEKKKLIPLINGISNNLLAKVIIEYLLVEES